MQIKLPDEVLYIINTLEKNGYEAFAVGGCVRDSLLGNEPQDWDICTSALPEQMMSCFVGHHIIETGLKHGTITLMLNEKPFECTTYRVDGKYKDNRRPESVKFVNVLKRDLARRDFTINAIAYNPKVGFVDYYEGQQDLIAKQIKCVGNADKRFSEDALRILRALRFASTFGFSVEDNTAQAMQNNKALLGNIAVERIATELNKLILGDNVRVLLSAHLPVIFEIIPEIEPMVGFEQNNPYHCYDVLTHTLASIDAAPKELVLRLTMLFHDIGKPKCYTESDDGIGHFYGHQQKSSDMAREILSRLKYDKATIHAVTELVLYHDAKIELSRKHIKRWLNRIGKDRLLQLLEVKRADAMARSEKHRQTNLDAIGATLHLLDEIIALQQCFSLKDLKVNGRDLIDAGVTEGTKIGIILNRLVDAVIDEEVSNDRSELLEYFYRQKMNSCQIVNDIE